MRTEARFPGVAAKAGHYESFYIKACRPGGGAAIWIRHTVHKRPGEQPTAALWFTYFDADAPGPRATKAQFGAGELSVPSGAYIQVAGSILEPGRAHGAIEAEGAPRASWDLGFTDQAEAFHHLPREFMYRSRLPKTKLLSPHPCASFTGAVEIDGQRVEVDGWRGMIGHNWGAEHAERWVWIHAAGLNGNDRDYIDIAAGRIKIGRWTTPWLANGCIVIDGEELRLGGLDRAYGTEIEEEPNSCEFTVPGKGVNVKGRVSAAAKDFVGWIYADPAGPEPNTLNCSIADIELKVERAGHKHLRAELPGAAAYELGTRDTDHGVPLQPYADG
jgi:hypothetical protein